MKGRGAGRGPPGSHALSLLGLGGGARQPARRSPGPGGPGLMCGRGLAAGRGSRRPRACAMLAQRWRRLGSH